MALNITRKLTLTQAVLTLCVLLPAGTAIYLGTEESLLREARKSTDLALQATAREILSQLDEDVLVEFTGSALPFSDLNVSTAHWALVRTSGELLSGAGALGDGEPEGMRRALTSRSLEVADGELLLLASMAVPKLTSEIFTELPPGVRTAAATVCPGGTYLRNKRQILGTQIVREVEMLREGKLVEVLITEQGKVLGGEVEELPETLPDGFIEGFVGRLGSDGNPGLKWKAYDSQLIAVLTFPAGERKPRTVAVNRYGEKFLIDPDGELSGSMDTSAIRLVVGVLAPGVPGSLLSGLLLGGVLVWLLMVAIGWFVTRRAFSPVEEMVSAADRIRPPHLEVRLPVGKVNDELSRIAETMNRMLDRLEKGFVREMRFTGDASHELRGPLAKVMAEIDLILSADRSGDEYREALVHCRRYAESLSRIVEALLLLARLDRDGGRLEKRPTDLEALVVGVVSALPEEDAGRLDLEIGGGNDPIVVQCAGHLISVLVRNLVENALRYSPKGERVTVRVFPRAGVALLEIEDRGPGIPEDRRDEVFGRFFRLDESRSRDTGGAGLGLAIVRAVARAHGSDVRFRASLTGGTIASFALRRSASLDETARAAGATEVPGFISGEGSLRR